MEHAARAMGYKICCTKNTVLPKYAMCVCQLLFSLTFFVLSKRKCDLSSSAVLMQWFK